jgi:hypothetical protein
MKIRVIDIIEKYGMDYRTAISLDMKGKTEISFEEAMCLDGRGILVDKGQDIYTGDLPQEERKSKLLRIFKLLSI